MNVFKEKRMSGTLGEKGGGREAGQVRTGKREKGDEQEEEKQQDKRMMMNTGIKR